MQAARMTRGFEQGKQLVSKTTAFVECFEFLPGRNHIARQLENSHQTQQAQCPHHLDICTDKACKVKRCNGQQINQGIETEGVPQTRESLARKLRIVGGCGQSHQVFECENSDDHHIENMKGPFAPSVDGPNVFGNDGHHADDDEPSYTVFKFSLIPLRKLAIKQPLISQ